MDNHTEMDFAPQKSKDKGTVKVKVAEGPHFSRWLGLWHSRRGDAISALQDLISSQNRISHALATPSALGHLGASGALLQIDAEVSRRREILRSIHGDMADCIQHMATALYAEGNDGCRADALMLDQVQQQFALELAIADQICRQDGRLEDAPASASEALLACLAFPPYLSTPYEAIGNPDSASKG